MGDALHGEAGGFISYCSENPKSFVIIQCYDDSLYKIVSHHMSCGACVATEFFYSAGQGRGIGCPVC